MPIPMTCPGCGARYTLKDDLAGKALRCRQCQGVLNVPSAGIQEGLPAAPVGRPAPPPLPSASSELFSPPTKRRDDDEDADRDYDRDYDRDDPHHGDLDPAFDRDKFLLRQKHFAINQKYYIQDEKGRNILFVERPIFFMQSCLSLIAGMLAMLAVIGLFVGIGFGLRAAAGDRSELWPILFGFLGLLAGIAALVVVHLAIMPKRHIQFYVDDTKRELLLEVLQDHKFMPINATYTVTDPDGKVLALFRKNNLYNFFRRRWYLYFPNGDDMAMALEDSLVMSLLRRFIGGLVGAMLLRTNFIITKIDGETVVGEFIRKFTLLDRYILDMSRDRHDYVDRRVAVALGIMLDTGEQR